MVVLKDEFSVFRIVLANQEEQSYFWNLQTLTNEGEFDVTVKVCYLGVCEIHENEELSDEPSPNQEFPYKLYKKTIKKETPEFFRTSFILEFKCPPI